jgi:hypothetical protein
LEQELRGRLLCGRTDGNEEDNRGTRDRHRGDARGKRRVRAHLEETMPAPRPLFGPATLKPSETKSDLLRLIERVQLEILYRHSR